MRQYPLRRYALLVSLALLTVVSLCCVAPPAKVETVPRAPEVQSVPNPAETVIAEIETIFQDGSMFAEIGYTEDARKAFDRTVAALYDQPEEIRQDPLFIAYMDQCISRIHAQELQWTSRGDTYTESDTGEQTNKVLSDDFSFITDKEAEAERQIVEETPIRSEIPIVLNKQVLSYIKAYSTRLKPVIQASLERSGKYETLFKRILREEGVPEELFYLPIVESGYKTFALSRAKAKGIWQFMRGTARLEGLTVDWWVDERCDPELSTRAAARHLKRLHDHFDDWYLALAAYNAGQGKISRSIRKVNSRDFWKIASKRWVLRRETKNYVPAFLAAVVIARDPERYGFDNLQFDEPLEYDTAKIDSCTDLRVVARLCDTTVRNIQDLNPHMRRLTTPVTNNSFSIRVPVGKQQQFQTQFAALPADQRVTLRYHRIREGETLSQIARKYQTSVSAISKANRIRNARLIRAGKTLVIPIGQGHDYYPPAQDNTVKKRTYPTGKQLVHKVRRGDTLYGIALRYRTDVDSVKSWNAIDSTLLKPGQRLTVYYNKSTRSRAAAAPVTGTSETPPGHHRVRSGDSLYSLSKRYGVSVSQIRRWNNLSGNLIHPGDVIRIQDI